MLNNAYTQAELEASGYLVKPAPVDDWRSYDERHPVPNYFDFDWLSSRHPDLYHAFALSTVGLMNELDKLVDLSGLDLIDVGAGTGRSAMGAARKAKRVAAVDAFDSVVRFGAEKVREAGLRNVTYTRGHRDFLPFTERMFDACICSWAELNYAEGFRVLKPGGYLILLGAAPGALCGELTAVLADSYPNLITEVAPPEQYDPDCPVADAAFENATWVGLPVTPPVVCRDFTYISDYGDIHEAAAIVGRLYGPKARRYLLDRNQSTLAWRMRIEIGQVRK